MDTVCLKIISIKIFRIKESDTNDSQAWHIEKDLQGTVDCLQASDLGVSLTRFCIALQGFTKLAVASERSPNPSPILHYASGLKHRTATSYLAIVCWRTTSRQENVARLERIVIGKGSVFVPLIMFYFGTKDLSFISFVHCNYFVENFIWKYAIKIVVLFFCLWIIPTDHAGKQASKQTILVSHWSARGNVMLAV